MPLLYWEGRDRKEDCGLYPGRGDDPGSWSKQDLAWLIVPNPDRQEGRRALEDSPIIVSVCVAMPATVLCNLPICVEPQYCITVGFP